MLKCILLFFCTEEGGGAKIEGLPPGAKIPLYATVCQSL